MANSIAFSVGNGGGGSIIKSIQRGESPIYTLHGKYQRIYEKDEISHADHFHVESIKIPISPVNPAKSIVLLSPVFMPVTNSAHADDMHGAISLADFQSTYFTCKIGYEYLSNRLGPDQHESALEYDSDSLCVTDQYDDSGAPIESTIRLTIDIDDIASVSYWIKNNYDGGLWDGDDVEITCDGAKVSYQIIEFY